MKNADGLKGLKLLFEKEDNSSMKCVLNNQIINQADAKVSISDLGILRGWGVFDFGYAQKTKVFYGSEHLERLKKSAETVGLNLPYSQAEILSQTEELLEKNKMEKSLVRWVLTGGISDDGLKPTFAILNEEFVAPPEKYYKEGIEIKTVNVKREIPTTKTLNYQIRFAHLAQMKKADVFELLYVVDGKVYECTTANIFMIKDGVLCTPKDEILNGITRGIIIKLAKESNVKVEEREISFDELLSADEVFISNTTKKILPVRKIDNKKFPVVGEVTKKLLIQFTNFETSYFK